MCEGTGRSGFILFLAICLTAIAAPAWACSVPVFRYALERWPSDAYRVVVFHRGELPVEDGALLASLGPEGAAGQKFANLSLEVVDLDAQPDEQFLKLWELQKTDELPWMVLQYPAPLAPAWSGPMSKEFVEQLLNSPLRKEIARRILKGETAVWVFLESGDTKQDDTAFKLLDKQLKYAGLNLKLEEINEEDLAGGLVSVDPLKLRVKFSVVRLRRDDPNEKLFVEMLLGSEGSGEDSLRDPKFVTKPMAFPVFGRGRVLYALVGAGINKETIIEGCQELIGPCTCQVKDQNPGIDMVMSIDWDRFIQPKIDVDRELPPLPTLASFTQTSETVEPSEATAQPVASLPNFNSSSVFAPTGTVSNSESAAVPGTMSHILRNTIIMIGLCVVTVIGASLFLVARKS